MQFIFNEKQVKFQSKKVWDIVVTERKLSLGKQVQCLKFLSIRKNEKVLTKTRAGRETISWGPQQVTSYKLDIILQAFLHLREGEEEGSEDLWNVIPNFSNFRIMESKNVSELIFD